MFLYGDPWVKDVQHCRLDDRFEKTRSIYSFGDHVCDLTCFKFVYVLCGVCLNLTYAIDSSMYVALLQVVESLI